MKSTVSFDEEAVRILLVGSEDEIGQGLALIDQHLRRRIWAWIRKRPWGAWMKPEDIADAWQETLIAVLKAAREERFDADRPLMPWLLKIVRGRAIDSSRRRSSAERSLVAFGETLKNTRVGRRSQELLSVEREEMLRSIREGILSLPAKQQRVLQVFVDGYPDSRDMSVLREAVSRVVGEEVTLAAVKRALQEGRRNVTEFLKRKGF